ncbi:MAG: hypothetical protein AB7G11_03755 [Phycisphaerales bacterium]
MSPDLLERLQQNEYDQAPVMVSGRPTGMVPTNRLSALLAAGTPLNSDEPALVRDRLAPDATLDQVLDVIATHRSAIVSDGADGVDAGFITLSDLNKHSLRSELYPLFAELEAELAAAIEARHVDPWTWLEFLDKDKQARLVGYWELSKREGVDIGPLAGTMPSELSRIVERTDPLRRALGFDSKGKWGDFVGGLVELRNGIMHPVRPLFATTQDVADVRQQLARLLVLLGRLDHVEMGP